MSPRSETNRLPGWKKRSSYDFLLEAVDRGEVRVRAGEHFDPQLKLLSVSHGIRRWAKRRSLDVTIHRLRKPGEPDALAVSLRSRPDAPSTVGRPPAPPPLVAGPTSRRAPNGHWRYDFLAGFVDAGPQLLVRGEHYDAGILQSSLARMLSEWAPAHGLRIEMRTAITDPDTGRPSPYGADGEILPYGMIVRVSSQARSLRDAA